MPTAMPKRIISPESQEKTKIKDMKFFSKSSGHTFINPSIISGADFAIRFDGFRLRE